MKTLLLFLNIFFVCTIFGQQDSTVKIKNTGSIEVGNYNRGIINSGSINNITQIVNTYTTDSSSRKALDSILHFIRFSYAKALSKEQELLKKSQSGIENWDSLEIVHLQIGQLLKQNSYLTRTIDSLKNSLGIVEKSKIRLVELPCSECHGNGSVLSFHRCSLCNGIREMECDICNHTRWVVCSECKGAGITGSINGRNLYCTNCNGKGTKQCSACDDFGRRPCIQCSGSGEVADTFVCKVCNKTGKVKDTLGSPPENDNYLCITNTRSYPINITFWYGYPEFRGEKHYLFESMQVKTLYLNPNETNCIHDLKYGIINAWVCTNTEEYIITDLYIFNNSRFGFSTSFNINRGKNIKSF